jgi:hypothetical protein
MLGCMIAAWMLFVAAVTLLFILGMLLEYPSLAVIAVLLLGLWRAAR